MTTLSNLPETEVSTSEIIFYQPNETIRIEVRMEDDTVWLTLDQISTLFGRDKSTISRHIKNVFDTNELSKDSVIAFFATTASDGKKYNVCHYNLDVIISVGYRVNSIQGTRFRQWANKVLINYLKESQTNIIRFERIESRLLLVESHLKTILNQHTPPTEGIFYSGQVFDAYMFV